MKKKQFSAITISELTEKAGVGRVSFYRNYESKEDVLLTYILDISSKYWKTHHEEKPDEAATKEEAYVRSMYTGLVFGILYHWLNSGMKESKEELNAIFNNMVLPYEIHEIENDDK